MRLDLAGKTAMVTGASKGIGLAVTRALLGEGATVAAGALTGSPELTELAGDGQVAVVLGDLTTADGCHTCPRPMAPDLLVDLPGRDPIAIIGHGDPTWSPVAGTGRHLRSP